MIVIYLVMSVTADGAAPAESSNSMSNTAQTTKKKKVTKMNSQVLLPCPCCGHTAELDTKQSYRNFRTGAVEDAICIYCVNCTLEISVCYADVPDITAEQVIETWNTRATDHIDQPRAMVVPDGWKLELIGPDEVVKLSRADGKWCGITHLSDSPRDGLLYPFLRAMLAAAPAPGDSQ
jgi:hypothetical protein